MDIQKAESQYVCEDCPDDSALVGFKKVSAAQSHSDRTGHTVIDQEKNKEI